MNHRLLFGVVGVGACSLIASQIAVHPVNVQVNRGAGVVPIAYSQDDDPTLHPSWAADLEGDPIGGIAGQYLDVEISSLSGVSQRSRIGNYPSGRIGMAGATTSCNIGNVLVPWFRQMDPRHPFIAQNLYRIDVDGRLEQIGTSWLKHGFFAADASGCGTCNPDYGNDHLDLGCQDTYGSGNNSDRTWLGPRYEVDPLTGDWDPCGSYFDTGGNGQPDCLESNHTSGLSPIAHMLRVDDADMDVADASFVYESYYVIANEDNNLNNVSYLPIRFNRNGDSWNPSSAGSMIRGMYVQNWGSFHHYVNDRTNGDAIIASRVVSIQGGYRFEYCVYNHSIWQQINSFHIPVGDGVTISNVGYHAPVEDETSYGTEAWDITVDASGVTWNCDDYNTNEFANTLRFGNIFTFWFDADTSAVASSATLGLHKPGDVSEITMGTIGPGLPDNIDPAGVVMTMTDLHRGQNATWTVSGCQPGERVYLAYSEAGFSDRVIGIGPTHLNGLNLDIELLGPGRLFATGRANNSGVAIVNLRVPNNAQLVNTAFQAVVPRGGGASVKSNVELRAVGN